VGKQELNSVSALRNDSEKHDKARCARFLNGKGAQRPEKNQR